MKAYLIVLSLMFLNACAPINTHFSCHETASDQCLSIEEVHTMTEAEMNKENVHCTTCDKPTIWFQKEAHHVAAMA